MPVPPETRVRPPHSPWHLGTLAVIAMFVGGLAVQTVTPLRLNGDVATYLSVASQVLDGRGFVDGAGPTVYPPGYPALIVLVAALGISVSTILVGLNAVAVVAAMWASVRVYRDALGLSAWAAIGTAALVPASYVVIKHATLVMADISFMAVATLAVAAMGRAAGGGTRAARALLGATVAVAVALALRTTAIALVPALVVSAGALAASNDRVRARLDAVRRRPWIGVAGVGVVVAALGAGAVALVSSEYGQDAIEVYRRWGAGILWNNVVWKATELGEIALNAPASRWMSLGVPNGLLVTVGAVAAAVVGVGMWAVRRRREAWPAAVYVLAFAGMLVLWPGTDARFWLGVWPVALGMGAAAVTSDRKAVRMAPRLAALWFVALGLLALAYSTRISIAGDAFPTRYAGGTMEPVYRAAWSGESAPDTSYFSRRFHRVLVRFGDRPVRSQVRSSTTP